jgi:adenylate cyclase
MFEHALALDPPYAWAYGSLGATYFQAWIFQWEQGSGLLEQAFGLAQKAVALDAALPDAHLILGQVYLWQKQHELAIAETEQAIALDPNNADGYVWIADILKFAGRPQEAIHLVEKAMRLNPHYPFNYLLELGLSYFLMGRNEEAVETLQRVISRAPNHLITHLFLTASYSELGREAETRSEAAEILRLNPTYSLVVWRQITPFKDPAVLERVLAALRKAGLK